MPTANKSYLAKASDVEKRWYVVDATDQVLGRLAVRIATVLMGKHKPTYTPHVDTGDFVIVLNVGKIKLTGARKPEQIIYQSYSGYPSGLKETNAATMLERHPDRVLYESVRRMLPKNRLARQMLKKLKLYTSDEHPHQAQMPDPLPE
jgi:large subunit ribosomal protein L13